ncbi:hypothetical protein [Mycolicibacterium sp. S2-37]|uniref:hypothetical protein n=1 Tax=Mycolicibacterium sp. S2-37 TaxID=2810297 RepID=UPI001F5E7211|nr:hypothetical protein [Mycolicibacterium sp. S2-37]
MTETPSTPSSLEAPTGPVVTATPPTREPRRGNRLNVVAAWVGIVAGVVFIVAVIFGTGFVLGAHSGGHGGGDRGPGPMMIHRGGPPPPMMFPMGPRAQFELPGPDGPGGSPGPGQGSGAQSPQPSAPAPARP